MWILHQNFPKSETFDKSDHGESWAREPISLLTLRWLAKTCPKEAILRNFYCNVLIIICVYIVKYCYFVIFQNIPLNFQILDKQASHGRCLVRMVRMVKDTSESADPSFELALHPQCPLDKSTRSWQDKNTTWQQQLKKEHSEKSKLRHGSAFAI